MAFGFRVLRFRVEAVGGLGCMVWFREWKTGCLLVEPRPVQEACNVAASYLLTSGDSKDSRSSNIREVDDYS